MSKKTNKNKTKTKANQLSKPKSASKNDKKGKLSKEKSSKKTIVKKPTKKIVKKKSNKKIVVKNVKKLIVKKITSKPKQATTKKTLISAKPVKKVLEKKIVSRPTVINGKKVNKTETTKPLKHVKNEKVRKPLESFDSDFEMEMDDSLVPEKKKYKRRKGGRKRKNKGDEEEPEILHDDLVEQLIRQTKKLKAQPKKPRILKTFVNPMTSLHIASPSTQDKKAANVTKKEPKGKYSLEYVMNTSIPILYEFLTSPSGLVEWFADDVSIHDGVFTFVWDGSAQKAKLVGFKENEFVRLQWLDKPEGTYFEFRIKQDTSASDISIVVTDFVDEGSDLEISKKLWDTQIDKLLHVISSY